MEYYKGAVSYEGKSRNLLPPLHWSLRMAACAAGGLQRREDEGEKKEVSAPRPAAWASKQNAARCDRSVAELETCANASTGVGELKTPVQP